MNLIIDAQEFRLSLVRFDNFPSEYKATGSMFLYNHHTKYLWGQVANALTLLPVHEVVSEIYFEFGGDDEDSNER